MTCMILMQDMDSEVRKDGNSCMLVCMYVCKYVCMFVYVGMFVHVCMYVGMYVCMYVCMCVSWLREKENSYQAGPEVADRGWLKCVVCPTRTGHLSCACYARPSLHYHQPAALQPRTKPPALGIGSCHVG